MSTGKMPHLLGVVYVGTVRACLPGPFTWKVSAPSDRAGSVEVTVALTVDDRRFESRKSWAVSDLYFSGVLEGIVADEVLAMAKEIRREAGIVVRLG